mmetsp:Transcript_12767/g.26887  ORF Transcript_12767/g.26887 Transcript_12767/m.26887 type:complete len:121 (+) Transcript_12767:230-592(+)
MTDLAAVVLFCICTKLKKTTQRHERQISITPRMIRRQRQAKAYRQGMRSKVGFLKKRPSDFCVLFMIAKTFMPPMTNEGEKTTCRREYKYCVLALKKALENNGLNYLFFHYSERWFRQIG